MNEECEILMDLIESRSTDLDTLNDTKELVRLNNNPNSSYMETVGYFLFGELDALLWV